MLGFSLGEQSSRTERGFLYFGCDNHDDHHDHDGDDDDDDHDSDDDDHDHDDEDDDHDDDK